MSKLENLYEARERLRKLDALNDELEDKLSELEEEIIQNEILPIVTSNIEAVLKQIKRNVVLIVDYSPENGVKVQISRRKKNSDGISGTAIISTSILPDKHVSYNSKQYSVKKDVSQKESEKKDITILRVTFPDGTVICEGTAKKTVIECVKKIGIQTVADLCVRHPETTLRRNGVPLVTKIRDDKYSHRQTDIGRGWLVFDNTSTKDKKKQLETISESLNLRLIVKEISK